jgi:hypothetical protein
MSKPSNYFSKLCNSTSIQKIKIPQPLFQAFSFHIEEKYNNNYKAVKTYLVAGSNPVEAIGLFQFT